MTAHQLENLTESDLDDIMDLETRGFAAAIRATRETYEKRFRLRHRFLGVRADDSRLAGIVSFSYGRFDRQTFDPSEFPASFKEYSTQPSLTDHNIAIIYNLGVDPDVRSLRMTKTLIHGVFDRAWEDGCSFCLADGPVPSYRGTENIPRCPALGDRLDTFLAGGKYPDQEMFLEDPILRLYHRLTGCEFFWVLRDFIPEDQSSGGMRVMLFRILKDWRKEWRE